MNEYSLIRLIRGVQVLWKLGISGRLVYYHTLAFPDALAHADEQHYHPKIKDRWRANR
jgi:hypothetical protein